jgi:hypothetical protein
VIARWIAAGAVSVALLAACGDDDVDTGPGDTTEIDGGETNTDDSTTTSAETTTGGATGGASQGNQIEPGDTTTVTGRQDDGY